MSRNCLKQFDEGGRVRLQTGGQWNLLNCVDTKLTEQPGAMEKLAMRCLKKLQKAL